MSPPDEGVPNFLELPDIAEPLGVVGCDSCDGEGVLVVVVLNLAASSATRFELAGDTEGWEGEGESAPSVAALRCAILCSKSESFFSRTGVALAIVL